MKNNMKKILAFLCAVVLFVTAVFTENAMNQAQAETETSTQTTSTEPTPVELYGFENVTLNGLVDTQNSVMVDEEYTKGTATYNLSHESSFDKKLFSAWVTFTNSDMTNWWENRICIGGTDGADWGLSVAPIDGGKFLKIAEAEGNKLNKQDNGIDIEASKVVQESFLGKRFLLQMGFEYLDTDNDGSTDSVRILVYVNGNECKKDIVENCSTAVLGKYVRVYINNNSKINIESVALPIKPVELVGFTNVDVDDFVDTSGAPMQEKEYVSADNARLYKLADGSTFDKKIFTAYVKFSHSGDTNWYNTRLHIGGAGSYTGVAVYTDGSTLKIQDMSQVSPMKQVTSNEVNLESFFGDPFLLQVGYAYIDEDSVRILVYVEGTKVYETTANNLKNLGGYIHLACDATNSVIGISNFTEEAKPVTLSSHDTITISDFQDSAGKEMEAKGYDYDSVNPTSQFSLKGGSNSFNEKLLSMKVKFGHRDGVTPDWHNRLAIPAADGINNGILVYVTSYDEFLHIDNYVGETKQVSIDCATAGVTSFKDNPFILQMSFKDTTNGLELGVYINGKLCATYNWAEAKTSDYSSKLDLTRSLKDAFIVVSDADAEEFPADPAIMPDSSFEKITFGSFGIKDGTYSKEMAGEKYTGNLHQKVLCGKVKFEGDSWFNIRLGGKDTTWDEGLYLAPTTEDSMEVKWRHENKDKSVNDVTNFTSEIAGVKFKGQEYDLMISLEVVDIDGNQMNDVRFGVWFNNKLYGDRYYTINDVGDSLGNRFAFAMDADKQGTVTLNSVKEYLPQPDESYEKVTFQHFLIEDGVYSPKGGLVPNNEFKLKDDLDKIVVCGDVLFTDTDKDQSTFNIILGGKTNSEGELDPWKGIQLYTKGDMLAILIDGKMPENLDWLTPATAGLGESFVGGKFSLMCSVEFFADSTDGDGKYNDIKIGLWFDGFQYNNTYFTIKDGGTAAELGNTFAANCEDGDSISLNSVSELIPQPDESLQKLSLPDFVHNGTTDIMESGTFSSAKSDNWYVSGNAKKHDTLDGKVVSFDILQSGKVATSSYRIRIGGIKNHWYGLVLNTGTDGNMMINWCKSSDGQMASEWITVDLNQVAVSNFVNETFNLMVSMEQVEANGNTTSDVKVRIWFNKIPYVHNGQDSFIYYDCGNDIGNILAVAAEDTSAKAFVSLRTDAEYQSNPNYYEDISDYRQGTSWSDFTHPEKDGYTFSGWFEEDTYETPIEPTKKSGKAYAKFVDDEILTMKAQVQLDEDTQKVPTDKTALRFVTTVDSLNYRQVAFKFAVQKEGNIYYKEYSTATNDEEGRKVYSQLYTVGTNDKKMTYEPNTFSWSSIYFKAWTLSDISSSDYGRKIKVTPYWITLDGTYVYGPTRYVSVNESTAGDDAKESNAVSMKFLGENTMPIGGAALWPASDDDSILFPNYITEEYFEMFADAGVNLIIRSGVDYKTDPNNVMKQLKYGEKYGIGVFVGDTTLQDIANSDSKSKDAELTVQLQKYSGSKAFSGIHIVDEPSMNGTWSYDTSLSDAENRQYTLYTGVSNLLKNKSLAYSNLYPVSINKTSAGSWWDSIFGGSSTEDKAKENYKTYVETVSNELLNDVISWDHYPFETSRKQNGSYDYDLYFWNLDLIRTTAQNQQKPFWAFIQAGSQWNNDGSAMKSEDSYYPTKSQFNWNVNTSLAFGAQGIQYFPLVQTKEFATDTVDAEWDFERNGLISAWGTKTPWYYYAQEMNRQIEAVDEVLMNSVSEKVVVPTSGKANSYTSGLSSVATSYDKLQSVSGDAMVGYFNYQGKTALYVVNNQMFDVGATPNAQSVTLTFDNAYKNIKKTENAKTTHNIETTSNNQLTLTDMEPGEGILLIVE